MKDGRKSYIYSVYYTQYIYIDVFLCDWGNYESIWYIVHVDRYSVITNQILSLIGVYVTPAWINSHDRLVLRRCVQSFWCVQQGYSERTGILLSFEKRHFDGQQALPAACRVRPRPSIVFLYWEDASKGNIYLCKSLHTVNMFRWSGVYTLLKDELL